MTIYNVFEATVRMFKGAPRSNIETHLPIVCAALHAFGLWDRTMLLMALATIRAETGSFRPLDEGISKYNTNNPNRPFGLYDGRADLGNTEPDDGPRFKGRGYIQLTGRSNYVTIGRVIGEDLVGNPELANDPETAAKILAAFLKACAGNARAALAVGNTARARRLVNGGTHGLDDFATAYKIGDQLMPNPLPDVAEIMGDNARRPTLKKSRTMNTVKIGAATGTVVVTAKAVGDVVDAAQPAMPLIVGLIDALKWLSTHAFWVLALLFFLGLVAFAYFRWDDWFRKKR